VLGLSVFLPWYAVTLTASGAASAQQELSAVAQEYGNASLQSAAGSVGADFSALAGQQIATLNAHQLLKVLSVVLLILASISLLAALFRLAGVSGLIEAGGGQIAALGGLAGILVLFRMLEPPAPPGAVVSLTLSWGICLALASSTAIVLGGFWATSTHKASRSTLGSWELRS
jgi:hypothetical protein